MNWRRVLRWLASRPLDRVERNLHPERYTIRRGGVTGVLSEEVKEYYNRAALENARRSLALMDSIAKGTQEGTLKVMEWRRHEP